MDGLREAFLEYAKNKLVATVAGTEFTVEDLLFEKNKENQKINKRK